MFIPDSSNQISIIQDVLVIKFLKIAHSDNDVNGKCLNSPYYVKHHGKLYKADCKSHSSTGSKFIDLTLGEIQHVPMNEVE